MGELQTGLALTYDGANRILSTWLGTGVRCSRIEPLDGGMINTVLRLAFDRDPYLAVIKLNVPGMSFADEAHGLRHLHARGFPCPDVYVENGEADLVPYSYLLLESLPGVHMGQATLTKGDRDRVERELADVLVDLHGNARPMFGRIGEPGVSRWTQAFMPRLHSVRAEAAVSRRLSSETLALVDQAIAVAPQLLAAQGAPTLVHSDIWAANVIVHLEHDGWHLSGLVDPGAQYADVELELAYLAVFNTVGHAFFETYTARRPLRPDHEARWLVYWLRTYLIHVWLFGDQHYRDMTARVAQDLVSRVEGKSARAPNHDV
jgi:fructosamine-3-kinase